MSVLTSLFEWYKKDTCHFYWNDCRYSKIQKRHVSLMFSSRLQNELTNCNFPSVHCHNWCIVCGESLHKHRWTTVKQEQMWRKCARNTINLQWDTGRSQFVLVLLSQCVMQLWKVQIAQRNIGIMKCIFLFVKGIRRRYHMILHTPNSDFYGFQTTTYRTRIRSVTNRFYVMTQSY